jgi:hypothetical protein
MSHLLIVIPAKAGTHKHWLARIGRPSSEFYAVPSVSMGPGLRRGDGEGVL